MAGHSIALTAAIREGGASAEGPRDPRDEAPCKLKQIVVFGARQGDACEMRPSASGEACTARPCSIHVHQVTLMPASAASSSRRRPRSAAGQSPRLAARARGQRERTRRGDASDPLQAWRSL